jgi:ribokinase
MDTQIDFLAIGDITTDAFIRLTDAEIQDSLNHQTKELCVRYGDKVGYDSMEEIKAVGNSANAAVSAARLGVKSALMAHLGKDYQGDACIEELKKNNVDTHYVFAHENIPTNYHYVLWYGVDRTILVHQNTYPAMFPNIAHPPKMIYLSSLGNGTEKYHGEIADFVAKNPETKLVFQPGTFQIKMGIETLKDIYTHTYAFFCNLEEAQSITKSDTKEVPMLIRKLHALGPKLVFISDGGAGAYASNGEEMYFMPIYPGDAFERTGAGDAFASTVSVALLQGKTLEEALIWGPINSMSVVQYVGAQKGLLTPAKIQQYLKDAPADYKPELLF